MLLVRPFRCVSNAFGQQVMRELGASLRGLSFPFTPAVEGSLIPVQDEMRGLVSLGDWATKTVVTFVCYQAEVADDKRQGVGGPSLQSIQ